MKRAAEDGVSDAAEHDCGGDPPINVPGKRPRRRRPQRHQWFDAWKTAGGDGLKTLVAATLGFLTRHEEDTKSRVRARKAVDEAHHRRRVEAIVCHLAHAILQPPPTGRIAVKLGNGRKGRSRYDSPVMGKPLSPLLLMLQELDFIDVNWRPPRGEVSSIAPSAWFARRVAEHGVTLVDFGRDKTEEVVTLNRNTREDTEWWDPEPGKLHREPIDYTDTRQTRRYRADLQSLNAFLQGADIAFLDDGLEPRVDALDRMQRRRFLLLEGQDGERFDQGGRLYGGWWQPLKSARRQHIRIDGEPVAILDYGSMFTRLAYAEVGATPPEGDLYAIPGAEGYRSGIKLAMNTLLFDDGPRRSWPKAIGIGVGDDAAVADPTSTAAQYDARLPDGWGVKRTKEAILQVHPALKAAWGRRLGYTLMFEESELLLAVLQDLAADGVPALGLHDGLIVAQSKAEEAREVMVRRGVEMTGIVIPVSLKE